MKIGGAELRRAILKLVSPANSGVGESNLVNAFFRLKNGSTKGSLGRVHIVDDKVEVERKMRVQGVCFGCGYAKKKLRSTPLSVSITPFSFTRRNVLRPAYGPSNLQNRWCQVDVCF